MFLCRWSNWAKNSAIQALLVASLTGFLLTSEGTVDLFPCVNPNKYDDETVTLSLLAFSGSY